MTHDSLRPFIVHTAKGDVRDLGTAFAVTSYPGDSALRVVVSEGRVRVSMLGQPASSGPVLEKGDVAHVGHAPAATVEHGVDVGQYLGWTQGHLSFYRAPLSDVVVQLGRWYDLRFVLQDSTLRTRRVTMAVSTTSANALVDAMGAALGLRAVRRGDTITLRADRTCLRPPDINRERTCAARNGSRRHHAPAPCTRAANRDGAACGCGRAGAGDVARGAGDAATHHDRSQARDARRCTARGGAGRQRGLVHGDDVASDSTLVTIHLVDVELGKAFDQVLKGTGFVAREKSGVVVIIRDGRSRAEVVSDTVWGGVWGQVRDSATNKPLAGVEVSIRGLRVRFTTNDSGYYAIRAPFGAYIVVARILGYDAVERNFVVRDSVIDNAATRLDIRDAPALRENAGGDRDCERHAAAARASERHHDDQRRFGDGNRPDPAT